MKFMLFTYRDPSVQLDPDQRAAIPSAVAAWCEEMEARGVRLGGHVLAAPAEAPTIRVRDGETQDVDEAHEVAAKNPGANFGILELRAIEPD